MNDLQNYLTDDSIFFAPSLEPGHSLSLILDKGLEQYGIGGRTDPVPEILWRKERYALQRSPVFLRLDPAIQDRVLARISRLNLSLSYFIERSGHQYGAKMILLAERMEEKSLYCLFAAEEAMHLRLFENFMNFKPDPALDWHPMLEPLSRVIRDGGRQACILFVQVLLEGFGMGHYRSLMEDCLHPPLVQAFQRILKDEARHHGAGLVLAKESTLTPSERDEVFEYTREFVGALQSANWVVRAMEECGGGLSAAELRAHHEAVGTREIFGRRLEGFREMLAKVDREGLLGQLEREGLFRVRETDSSAS